MELTISFTYIAVRMESGDGFLVEFSEDNGGSWTTVTQFVMGTDFDVDVRENTEFTLDSSNFNFTSTAKIRFRSFADGTGEATYIDNVLIAGTLSANQPPRFTAEPVLLPGAVLDAAYSGILDAIDPRETR